MKTFDCQNMPKKVQKEFFDRTDHHGNSCYVEWEVYGEGLFSEEVKANSNVAFIYKGGSTKEDNWLYFVKGDDMVSDWLFENGAKGCSTVLVKHWW